MTRRENRGRRRKPYREPRPRVLIVCGGEKTEPAYFRGLRDHYRNPAVEVKVLGKRIDPANLVKHAASPQVAGDFDEVWCVVDVDQFELAEAVDSAGRQRIRLAISNPCFEYWLLLHFEDSVREFSCYGDVLPFLLRHVPHYAKNELRFVDFSGGVVAAFQRAKARCLSLGSEHTTNPATGVWVVAEIVIPE